MSAEGASAARAAMGKQLTLREAELILGLESGAGWDEVLKARGCCWRVSSGAAAWLLFATREGCWGRARIARWHAHSGAAAAANRCRPARSLPRCVRLT